MEERAVKMVTPSMGKKEEEAEEAAELREKLRLLRSITHSHAVLVPLYLLMNPWLFNNPFQLVLLLVVSFES